MPLPTVAVALLVAAAETEDVKPLAAKSLLITLGLIVLIVGAILLAGFGYFGPSDSND